MIRPQSTSMPADIYCWGGQLSDVPAAPAMA